MKRNFGSNEDIPIHISSASSTEKAKFCESFEAAHSSHKDSAEIAKLLNITLPPIRIDSQCKYGIIARGNAEIYLRFPREGYVENIWVNIIYIYIYIYIYIFFFWSFIYCINMYYTKI